MDMSMPKASDLVLSPSLDTIFVSDSQSVADMSRKFSVVG